MESARMKMSIFHVFMSTIYILFSFLKFLIIINCEYLLLGNWYGKQDILPHSTQSNYNDVYIYSSFIMQIIIIMFENMLLHASIEQASFAKMQ